MKKKVKRQVREHRVKEDFNVFAILRMNHPRTCDWLRIFPWARRQCLICEEPEPRRNSDFVECPNEYCHFVYCGECWIDVGQICFACLNASEDTSSGIETDDESGMLSD